ncbi:MAG: hypothetical protein ABJB21_00280 [bacterium]
MRKQFVDVSGTRAWGNYRFCSERQRGGANQSGAMLSRPAAALATDSAAVEIHSLCETGHGESEEYTLRAPPPGRRILLVFLNLK